MKVIKTQVADDDYEFNVTLDCLETISLIAMEHNSVLRLSAALLKAMDSMPHGEGKNETCNDKEIQ